jgi:hypothetical protein
MLEAAVRNGVFESLDRGPKSVDEVAAETGASVRGLRALLNALASLGLLTRDTENRFGLPPDAAAFLVKGKPGYMGGLIRNTSAQLIPRWLKLTEAVRTGKPAQGVNNEQVGSPFFREFVNDIFPVNYGAAKALAREMNLADTNGTPRVLDLAAGSGVWGIALAESSPRVKVTAVDWPGVLEVTRENVQRYGMEERFSFVAGDLASADFGTNYNVATLGHILHSEGERRSRSLLRKTFDALAPGGTIAIQEFLVEPDRSGPPAGLIFAVNMLVNTDEGDTWSLQEIGGWLRDTGFEDVRSLDAPGPSPLILATRPK